LPQQNTSAPQEQHVVASPNPTVDDSKTPADVGPKKVEGTPLHAAGSVTQSPMKTTTKSKSKSKHKQTKPRS
jgi:hypothetical protein